MDVDDHLLKQQALPETVPLYNPSLKTDFVYKSVFIPRRGISRVPSNLKKVVLKRLSDMIANERDIGYVSKEKRRELYNEIGVEL